MTEKRPLAPRPTLPKWADLNPDGATIDDVRIWVHAMRINLDEMAPRMFPRHPAAEQHGAAVKVWLYCEAKYRAMESRLIGKIDNALRYEAECDKIYKRLPEWARW